MKRFLAAVLAIGLSVGALAGCSKAPSTSTNSDEKVKFTWLINKVEVKNELEQLAQKYMDTHKNVEIVTEVAGGSVEPYATRLKAKLGSNDMPALFVIEGPQDIETFDSYIADLSNSKLADMAQKGILDPVTYDGKVRALPMSVEGYGLIYNKEMFNKAGVDPSKITSYEELENAVKVLDSKKAELGIDAVFSLPAKETWIVGSHMLTAFLNGEFKTPIDAYNAKTVEFKYADAFKKFLDLQIKYSVHPQGDSKNLVNVTYADQLEKGFALGKVAMIHNGSWVAPVISNVAPEMVEGDKIGFLPIPITGYREDSIAIGGTPYITLNAKLDEKVQKEAMNFLEWIYTSPEGQEFVVNTLKFVPPYSGFEKFEITDPLAKEVIKYMEGGKNISYMFLGTPPGWKNYAGEKVQEYVQGKSWDQCVKELKDKWAELRP